MRVDTHCRAYLHAYKHARAPGYSLQPVGLGCTRPRASAAIPAAFELRVNSAMLWMLN
jgi:hypothetical protein